jgi:hypothetical protein
MKKIVFFSVSIMFSSMLCADANVEKGNKNNSYLLIAPGTITGAVIQPQTIQREQQKQPAAPGPVNSYIQSQPQKYIQDSYNFPQYGRLQAHPNPWLDQPVRRQQDRMPPDNWQNFDNPWDTSKLPSLAPNGYQNKPMPGASMRDPAYGFYGDNYGNSSFYPQFSSPLDQNIGGPPSAAGFPYMDGLMPGLGKDDGKFPFMPFGMF